MIARLKKAYSHQCDDFSIAPLGSYQLCHFDYFGFQSEDQKGDYSPLVVYSPLDSITAKGEEIVTEWKTDQNNRQMIVVRYRCDILANPGFITSVRKKEKCFFVDFATRLVCPLGNNQQDVELILCHLRNTQG
jgi:hypothetical protein